MTPPDLFLMSPQQREELASPHAIKSLIEIHSTRGTNYYSPDKVEYWQNRLKPYTLLTGQILLVTEGKNKSVKEVLERQKWLRACKPSGCDNIWELLVTIMNHPDGIVGI